MDSINIQTLEKVSKTIFLAQHATRKILNSDVFIFERKSGETDKDFFSRRHWIFFIGIFGALLLYYKDKYFKEVKGYWGYIEYISVYIDKRFRDLYISDYAMNNLGSKFLAKGIIENLINKVEIETIEEVNSDVLFEVLGILFISENRSNDIFNNQQKEKVVKEAINDIMEFEKSLFV